MNNYGYTIKKIRELKNYTQEYVALQLGITQAAYSKIENGRSDISVARLSKVAILFDVELKDVLLFDEKLFLKGNHTKPDEVIYPSMIFKIENLYEDKIRLLEKLLDMAEKELQRYKGENIGGHYAINSSTR